MLPGRTETAIKNHWNRCVGVWSLPRLGHGSGQMVDCAQLHATHAHRCLLTCADACASAAHCHVPLPHSTLRQKETRDASKVSILKAYIMGLGPRLAIAADGASPDQGAGNGYEVTPDSERSSGRGGRQGSRKRRHWDGEGDEEEDGEDDEYGGDDGEDEEEEGGGGEEEDAEEHASGALHMLANSAHQGLHGDEAQGQGPAPGSMTPAAYAAAAAAAAASSPFGFSPGNMLNSAMFADQAAMQGLMQQQMMMQHQLMGDDGGAGGGGEQPSKKRSKTKAGGGGATPKMGSRGQGMDPGAMGSPLAGAGTNPLALQNFMMQAAYLSNPLLAGLGGGMPGMPGSNHMLGMGPAGMHNQQLAMLAMQQQQFMAQGAEAMEMDGQEEQGTPGEEEEQQQRRHHTPPLHLKGEEENGEGGHAAQSDGDEDDAADHAGGAGAGQANGGAEDAGPRTNSPSSAEAAAAAAAAMAAAAAAASEQGDEGLAAGQAAGASAARPELRAPRVRPHAGSASRMAGVGHTPGSAKSGMSGYGGMHGGGPDASPSAADALMNSGMMPFLSPQAHQMLMGSHMDPASAAAFAADAVMMQQLAAMSSPLAAAGGLASNPLLLSLMLGQQAGGGDLAATAAALAASGSAGGGLMPGLMGGDWASMMMQPMQPASNSRLMGGGGGGSRGGGGSPHNSSPAKGSKRGGDHGPSRLKSSAGRSRGVWNGICVV